MCNRFFEIILKIYTFQNKNVFLRLIPIFERMKTYLTGFQKPVGYVFILSNIFST